MENHNVDNLDGGQNDDITNPSPLLDGTVEGTSGNDDINLSYTGDPEGDRIDNSDAILPGAGPQDDLVYAYGGNDFIGSYSGNDEAYGGAGDDLIMASDGNDTLFGDEGNDWLKGQEGADSIYGGLGDDRLRGGDANDVLFGGANDDLLEGEAGDDSLSGGAGIDVILGGDDRDTITSVDGGDTVDGGAGGVDNDTLDLSDRAPGTYQIVGLVPDSNGNGFNGTLEFLDGNGDVFDQMTFTEIENIIEPDDPTGPMLDGTVEGTSGDDLIDLNYLGDPDGDRIDNEDALLSGAAPNDDLVYAFGGNDTVFGYDADDDIYGGDGNDTVYGGTGNDIVSGDAGDDLIDTRAPGLPLFDNPYPPLPADPDPFDDRDTAFGGSGNDSIQTGDDADKIYGGAGNDSIDAGIDNDWVSAGVGNDTVIGGEGSDVIAGNGGDDVIYGGLGPSFPDGLNIPDVDGDLVTNNGRDVIYGGSGNDTIFGLDDDDRVFGGNGNDTINAGVDDDAVFGGRGDDTITGGQGTDVLTGEDDRDTFIVTNGTEGAGDAVFGGSGGDDFDTLNLTAAGPFRIVGTTTDSDGNGIDGTIEYLDADGNVTGSMTFENIEQIIPCFTPGTLIATPRGERLVEELREGDRIITRDNGIQEIRWIGQKEISGKALVNVPHLKPILIKAGSLGNGLPERDLVLSPNHRVLMANERTQLYFEENEVLAAAKHLVGSAGIHELDAMGTTYIHFMFDRHEVVLSNGAWTESFQPGDYSLKGIGDEQRSEIMELFPELKTKAGLDGYQAARKLLKKHEARLLVK